MTNTDHSGWLEDDLDCVNRITDDVFTLDDIYTFEEELQEKYPKNNHVKDKIRQKLQVLRDNVYIEFMGNGEYRKLTKDKQNSAKTYVVSIEETVVQEFEVEATNEEEALKPAEEHYNTGEYVLGLGEVLKGNYYGNKRCNSRRHTWLNL